MDYITWTISFENIGFCFFLFLSFIVPFSRLCYVHNVSLPVRLFVTLVDCDHKVQQKVEIGR